MRQVGDEGQGRKAKRAGRGALRKGGSNLGCKFILGLVEGISCCLQSCYSPLNSLHRQRYAEDNTLALPLFTLVPRVSLTH